MQRLNSFRFTILIVASLLSSPIGAAQTKDALNTEAAQNEKAVYGILIDNTGSLRSQFPDVVGLSKGIVERTYLRGSISLFNFRSQGDNRSPIAMIAPGTEWSQDKNLLEKHINNLFVVPGQTALMDAINLAAEQIIRKAGLYNEAVQDKVLFLVTDGEERASEITEKQLIKRLQEAGIKVYAVGLIKELDNEGSLIGKAPREKAVAFLEKITKETGGHVVFAKSKKNNTGNLLNELFTK